MTPMRMGVTPSVGLKIAAFAAVVAGVYDRFRGMKHYG